MSLWRLQNSVPIKIIDESCAGTARRVGGRADAGGGDVAGGFGEKTYWSSSVVLVPCEGEVALFSEPAGIRTIWPKQ